MEKIPVNVVTTPEETRRILAEEATWSAGRLVLLGVVTLSAAIGLLYYLAHMPV